APAVGRCPATTTTQTAPLIAHHQPTPTVPAHTKTLLAAAARPTNRVPRAPPLPAPAAETILPAAAWPAPPHHAVQPLPAFFSPAAADKQPHRSASPQWPQLAVQVERAMRQNHQDKCPPNRHPNPNPDARRNTTPS